MKFGGYRHLGSWVWSWNFRLYRWPETLRQRQKREEAALHERKADHVYRMLMWWRKRQGLA